MDQNQMDLVAIYSQPVCLVYDCQMASSHQQKHRAGDQLLVVLLALPQHAVLPLLPLAVALSPSDDGQFHLVQMGHSMDCQDHLAQSWVVRHQSHQHLFQYHQHRFLYLCPMVS